MKPVVRACGWIDDHLSAFVIEQASPSLLPSLKAVAELAHAGDFLTRSLDAEARTRGRRWLDLAWRQMAGGEVVRSIIAADARFVPAAVTYLPFHLSGYRNEALRATIAAQSRRATLVPMASAMTAPALRVLGLEPDHRMEAQARAASVLANRIPAADLTQDATYALVHECLYASRWGHEVPHLDAATAAYVLETLPALVARRGTDADLLAELILATHALSLPCVDHRSWSGLAQAQTEAGNVVPPNGMLTRYKRQPHPLLSRTYHTTLAAIMAWAACRHGAPFD